MDFSIFIDCLILVDFKEDIQSFKEIPQNFLLGAEIL